MGSSTCTSSVLQVAREVGSQIARRGGILICGGRGGVMEAAAAGARDAGGITVGILPGTSDSEANSSIDIPIVTGLGDARNAVNVLTSQAIIAIHGGYGTLSEIALALKAGTPVVTLQSWFLKSPDGETPADLVPAAEPGEAVSIAMKLAASRRPV
jgi:uncharacterized protein (TIGR00725 family)